MWLQNAEINIFKLIQCWEKRVDRNRVLLYPNLYVYRCCNAIRGPHYFHYSPLFSANSCHTNGALQFSLMKTSPPSLLIPSFRALLSAGKLGC